MSSKLLTNRQIADLCRSLSSLLHAGISAGDACHLLASEESGNVHQLLKQLGALMDEGTPLAEALQACSCMPVSTLGLIHTGEYTGRLEEALWASSQYHETQDRTERQIRTSLGYPILLLILMLCVIGVLLIYVLPVFASVYASLGTAMTGIAGGLLWIGQALKHYLPLLFSIILFLLLSALLLRIYTPARNAFIKACSRILENKRLIREFQNSRFMQALSMGIHGGLVPEEAVALAAELMADSPAAAARCQACAEQIRAGSTLSEALFASELVDSYGCRMLSLGNKTGSMDRIAAELADRMQEHSETHLQEVLSRVEPAIVLVSSLLVGLILLSVMLPLMQVLSALG